MPASSPESPALCLTSAPGMRIELNANGSVRRFECGAISLALFAGNEIEGGPANLYLRCESEPRAWTPLLGPRSHTRFGLDRGRGRLIGTGSWRGIDYALELVLAAATTAWFWHVRLRNATVGPLCVDLTYTQDLALAPYGAVRMNEYYVSQYIDHCALHQEAHGTVIASRQNQAVEGRCPWSLIGSLRTAVSFATDARQFHGLAVRAGETPVGLAGDLPGRCLQHEHSMVALREAPMRLEPGAAVQGGFFGLCVADHPPATSPADLDRLGALLALPEAVPAGLAPVVAETADATTLFSAAPLLDALDLDDAMLRTLFGSFRRHEELDEAGTPLAFFHGANRHVVLRAKELRVLRPHGHLLRTGHHSVPDETALTSTVWMSGVFHSMLTQGHVSINRLLSTVHGYLGFYRSQGLRVFAEVAGRWQLLDVPSAFEIAPDACRWIYRHAAGVLELRAEASSEPHELRLTIEVSSGAPTRFLLSHHIALNGDDGEAPGAVRWWREADGLALAPASGSELARRFPQGSFLIAPTEGTGFHGVGGDELLFLDGRPRHQPYLCIITAPARAAGIRIRGRLVCEPFPAPVPVGDRLEARLTLAAPLSSPMSGHVARMADIVPWFTHNALVHYLSPRGLEQYSGGGWGTRDVCQGPVEMLLALARMPPMRDLLLRVMAAQNPDGDWPQWFMFFERERDIRAGDSHGDIVFWPLVVLGQYLIASGDAGVLDESVPYFDSRGAHAGERATVWQHAQRALALIERRVIAGTALAAYGHGDWNDALQPVDPAMRERLCSAWTVTLHCQALTLLAQAMKVIGRTGEALDFERRAATVRADFRRLLLVDGVLAGYALFEDGGRVRYLLHPSDESTGVRYSALAMIHAILEDMLTPAETRAHLLLIGTQLHGPDGLRLFDRPLRYHGGPQRLFQRAESAAFFGREIGLMYMHAHLRYAQALAHVGDAEGFLHALCQANPIGICGTVPSATVRQANCYYSSSDAAFEDRYQASAQYPRVADGSVALDGGWRVYSSGAGIALSLIKRSFLGLSEQADVLRVDPVIPVALDGLRVQTTLRGRPLEVCYRIGAAGCGVNGMALNDRALTCRFEANAHRRGAALTLMTELLQQMRAGHNVLRIDMG